MSSFLRHTKIAARHPRSTRTAAVVAPAIMELWEEDWEGGEEYNAVGIAVVNVWTSPSARVVTAVLQDVEVL